mmetsp:Transcript_26999/g.43244  ORF Transcript_26999/g.43244 Transcript_26999/m.43244 type:complete len:205 (-) Transcript_26999:2425-3039(-)
MVLVVGPGVCSSCKIIFFLKCLEYERRFWSPFLRNRCAPFRLYLNDPKVIVRWRSVFSIHPNGPPAPMAFALNRRSVPSAAAARTMAMAAIGSFTPSMLMFSAVRCSSVPRVARLRSSARTSSPDTLMYRARYDSAEASSGEPSSVTVDSRPPLWSSSAMVLREIMGEIEGDVGGVGGPITAKSTRSNGTMTSAADSMALAVQQ